MCRISGFLVANHTIYLGIFVIDSPSRTGPDRLSFALDRYVQIVILILLVNFVSVTNTSYGREVLFFRKVIRPADTR